MGNSTQQNEANGGTPLAEPLDSSRWFAHGWARAARIPPGIARYPQLAAERLPCRLWLAQRREAQAEAAEKLLPPAMASRIGGASSRAGR